MEPRDARRPGRKPPRIAFDPADVATLERWAAGDDAPPALAQRARVVLACAGGASNREVADELGVSAHLVGRWRARFVRGGITALVVEARPGAPIQLDVTRADPGEELPRWVSKSTAARAARAASLRPDLAEAALGPDAALIGLHVFVSDVVFALAPGRRGGAVDSLAEPDAEAIAALRALTRRDVAMTTRRSNAVRTKRFLRAVAAAVPEGPIHLVVDRAPEGILRRWLERRPRLAVHPTGTLHAWWALLERWIPTASPSCLEAVTTFVAAPTHAARELSWSSGADGAPPSSMDAVPPSSMSM